MYDNVYVSMCYVYINGCNSRYQHGHGEDIWARYGQDHGQDHGQEHGHGQDHAMNLGKIMP